MELNGTIAENRVDLGGTITKTKALSGALAPTGGGGSAVVVRGAGADSIVSVNSNNPNTATGSEAIALGGANQSTAPGAMTIGTNNIASAQNAIAIGSKVNTGDPNTASGTAATAIGVSNTASGNGAVAIGYRCESTKIGSAAIGYQTHATGNAAVALGSGSTASGTAAVAAGNGSTASGGSAFAANRDTKAEAAAASAFGYGTDATGARSLVAGSYNEPDTNEVDTTHGAGARKYAVIIGNGTADDARSNAATLDWDGNAVFAGKATVGAAPVNDMDVATKKYVDDHGGSSVTVDSALSDSSTNPVQNKIIKAALDACEKKLVAEIAALDDLVPFYCEAGDVIVMSSAEGTSFTPTQIRFYDEAGTQRTYWGISGAASPRTLNMPAGKPQQYFVGVTGGTAQTITIVNKTRQEAEYENSVAKTNVDSKITAPSSPAAGAFLVWNGSAWAAQTLSTWQGGNY